VRGPVATVSAPFTDGERLTAAQMLRRNLRQAFYDLMLSDEELQEAQGLIDFTSEFRPAGQEASAGATRTSRRNALRVEILLSRARIELICAQGRRRMALSAVNAVLNRAPDVPLTIVGDLADPVPLPSLEAAIRLSKAMDVDLRELRQGVQVQRSPPASSVPPALPTSPGRTPLSGLAAREQALDAGMRERFARIDIARHAAARFKDALLPTALDTVARASEEYRFGRADVMELLEARRHLVDVRRAYLHVLHDLRLSEADVEERVPALGVNM
jgi:outer membrane protein TolC